MLVFGGTRVNPLNGSCLDVLALCPWQSLSGEDRKEPVGRQVWGRQCCITVPLSSSSTITVVSHQRASNPGHRWWIRLLCHGLQPVAFQAGKGGPPEERAGTAGAASRLSACQKNHHRLRWQADSGGRQQHGWIPQQVSENWQHEGMPESREVKIIMDGGLAESRRANVRKAEQAVPLKGTSNTRMQFCVLFFLEGLFGLQHIISFSAILLRPPSKAQLCEAYTGFQ